MEPRLKELKRLLCEVNDLNAAAALLYWDQTTYMPPGGAAARARQIATLRRLAHEKMISPAIGELLAELRTYEESLPYEADDASLIRIARRDYERGVRIPPAFIEALSNHTALLYDIWTRARAADDFAVCAPYLEKTLQLSRELAGFFPGHEHIIDPLIDLVDEGMTASLLRPLFEELRRYLMPMIERIASLPLVDDSCLHRQFPEDRQLAFGLEIIQRFGFDVERGRQDRSHHPFMTKFSLGDVRITTRIQVDDLSEALFSTMHEAGHALYEQGIRPELEGTPLARGASSGLHESQSRLWENMVGRSLDFWRFFYPRLQEAFPTQLGQIPLTTFYRAINKVRPTPIRTNADELTYNLHVIIRFELEVALLEGTLDVRDLPEAWREAYKEALGIVPENDRDGVLQDVHWYSGLIGGEFQGYALGNIIAAQLFEAALQAHPEIIDQMRRGSFEALRAWLKANVYQHGCKFPPGELIERATGSPLSITPYTRYLAAKYDELYPTA